MKFDHTTLEGIEAHEQFVREEIDALHASFKATVDKTMAIANGSDDCQRAVADELMRDEAELERRVQEIQSMAFVYFGNLKEQLKKTSAQQFVGKAQVVRVDGPGTSGQACDFQFLEKPTDWILQ